MASLNTIQETILKQRYCHDGESTWEEVVDRVSNHVAKAEQKASQEEITKQFTEILKPMYFIPGGRILYGSNHKIPQLLNCFILEPSDTRESISQLLGDVYTISTAYGGVGTNFSNIRPKGAILQGKIGLAPGCISNMRMVNEIGGQVKAGGARRAALMATLHCEHPDLLEFLNVKLEAQELNNFNISVLITDKFIKYAQKNKLWEFKFQGQVWETHKVSRISELGNDTIVVPSPSRDGLIKILEFHYKKHFKDTFKIIGKKTYTARDIWALLIKNAVGCGEPGIINIDFARKHSNVNYFQNIIGVNPCIPGDAWTMTDDGPKTVKELVGVKHNQIINGKLVPTTKNGFFKTGYEKIYKITTRHGHTLRLTANHEVLVTQDRNLLAPPVLTGEKHKPIFCVDKRVKDLNSGDVLILSDNFGVQWDNKDSSIEIIRKTFDEHCTVDMKGKVIFIHHDDIDNLYYIQRILLRLGINSILSEKYMSLTISRCNITRYSELINFSKIDKREDLSSIIESLKNKKQIKDMFVSEITSITEEEKPVDVYDATTPSVGRLNINGFIVHNCAEVSGPKNSSCCLGSLNLGHEDFVVNGDVNWHLVKKSIKTAVRFLDNVISINHFPLQSIKEEAHQSRRVGIGVMGLHYLLIRLGLRYGSEKSLKFLDRLFNTIKHEAYIASCYISREKTSFPMFDADKFLDEGFAETLNPYVRSLVRKYGIRNAILLTAPPTGSTSMVAGVSSGIEPIFAPIYKRRWREGSSDVSREELVMDKLMAEYVLSNKGLKNFVGTYDITPEEHMQVQAIIQRHTDNAISKTIGLPSTFKYNDSFLDTILEYISEIKGFTFYKAGSRGQEPLTSVDIDTIKDIKELAQKATLEAGEGGCNKNSCSI